MPSGTPKAHKVTAVTRAKSILCFLEHPKERWKAMEERWKKSGKVERWKKGDGRE
jgi:hypothetical protein